VLESNAFPVHSEVKVRLCKLIFCTLFPQFSMLLTKTVFPCRPARAARVPRTLAPREGHKARGRVNNAAVPLLFGLLLGKENAMRVRS